MTICKAALLGVTLMLAGCQTASVQNKEDLLAAAGFVPQPANSPQRIAAMKTLPPHKFAQQIRNSQITYVYADPSICRCVYFGNQAAYAQYRGMVFQKNLANEQQMTATMAQDSFDLGPWGA